MGPVRSVSMFSEERIMHSILKHSNALVVAQIPDEDKLWRQSESWLHHSALYPILEP